MIGVARDVTARKQLEENQALLERRLQEARNLESLGVLAGGIAHDFNNLLSGILGNVNLAQLDAVDPTLRGYLDAAEKQSLRAGDLCKQMLAYAGKNQPRLAPVDLEALVDEVARIVHLSNPGHFTIIVDHAGKIPLVSGDAVQLRQAILNIALNAAEAFEGRRGTIQLTTGFGTLSPEVRSEATLGPGERGLAPGVYATSRYAMTDRGCRPTSSLASSSRSSRRSFRGGDSDCRRRTASSATTAARSGS